MPESNKEEQEKPLNYGPDFCCPVCGLPEDECIQSGCTG